MNHKFKAALLLSAFGFRCLAAEAKPAAGSNRAATAPIAHAYFIDPAVLDLAVFMTPPPDAASETTRHELAELHRVEAARTPQQVAAAKADDQEEDIFIFRDVLGNDFNAASLPLTAALSLHIHSDGGVASKPLKRVFSRLRPYQLDKSLHPVCALTSDANSYPSGHSLSAYLLAFTLIRMVPEKRAQISARADAYTHNRMVCGVHYASDVEASRSAAGLMFGYMLASPEFEAEFAAARKETRARLGLPLTESAHD